MRFSIIKIPKSKNLSYFFAFFSIFFIFQFVTATIANYINPELTSSKLQFDSLLEEFVVAVVIAPIIETLIFQYAIIETLLNLKVHPWISIIISALLFGVSHWYNPIYVIVLTVVGCILAYYYVALRYQNGFTQISLVVLIHALFNTIVFLDKNFLHLT